jgi:CHAT domain-containing protein/Flp pilus assembly protein TadD
MYRPRIAFTHSPATVLLSIFILSLPASAIDKINQTNSLQLTQQPPTTGQNTSQQATRVAAQKAFDEGLALYKQQTAQSLQQAIVKWKEAVVLWRQVGDKKQEAITLLGIGRVYDALGDKKQALQFYNQSLPLWREVGDKSGEATTLNNIGLVYDDLGDKKQALQFYNQSLPLSREVGDKSGEARTLNNIGKVYDGLGDKKQALQFYNQSLPLSREVGDKSGEARTLNNIGKVYDDLGDKKQALQFYNQSLTLKREVGDKSGEATTLNNIGKVYDDLGDKKQALQFYNQSLTLKREVGDKSGEATTLNNIGLVYSALGDKKQALQFLNQSLPLSREVGDKSGEATTLNNIGLVYSALGDKKQALQFYNQSLPLWREVGNKSGEATTLSNIGLVYSTLGDKKQALQFYNQSLPLSREVGDKSGEATTLNNIGKVYDDLGDKKQALQFYNQSLPLTREVGDKSGEATTLNNIGLVYSALGDKKQALEFYNQSLPLSREVGDKSQEATTLNNIGLVYDDLGDKKQALEFYNQSLPLTREVGDKSGEAITLSNIGRVYQDTKQPKQAIEYLQQSVEITLQLRRILDREFRKTFLSTERGPAIALIDLLIEQNQSESAYEWLNLTSTADLADYSRLIGAKVSNPEAQKTLEAWNQKNQQLEARRKDLQKKFTPQLSQEVNAFQEEINKEAETISRRFPEIAELFETTPKDITQLRNNLTPGNVVIQPVLLTGIKNIPNNLAIFVITKDKLTVTKTPINPEEFEKLITDYRKELVMGRNLKYRLISQKIYDILIRPVENQINTPSTKQVSFIATDKLRYIPFETLIDSKTNQFLIEKYPINNLTRLSTRPLQQKSQSRQTIFGLGNPFPKDETRNLPGAEIEVKNIVSQFPGSEAYVGAKATLSNFKTQASKFPFLHLATHGCFEKGGCAELGLESNSLLFADKPYNIADAALLGLKNTQLIVLSACQTSLQADSNGEEFAGISYIFERAGASAVIATLWNVDDEATKDLMVEFYQNLKKGNSKAEALRQAKISLIKSDNLNFKRPYYWAPFLLIGDGS